MKSTRLFLSLALSLTVGLSGVSPAIAQSSPTEVGKTIIILDASGSMWGQINGVPKIEIARDVIGDLLSTLNPDLELGLMAYGHREKGNCDDIELLVPPGKVDRAAFLKQVQSIIPKGKTPLTDAVEQAAGFLQYEENAANVILVSDGLETCDRDPCVLAGILAAKGIRFRAHIVAFDVSAEDSKTFKCLADETGGAFLQAQDAATLKDALEMAVEAIVEVDEPEMPAPKLDPATIEAPENVAAGSVFEVKWDGPNNRGDYITILEKEAEDDRYGNYAYTFKGSPAELTAPIRPGPCEVRYLAATGQVLGRVDVMVTAVEATVEGPTEVVAGSEVPITWSGPDNRGDYITIVPKGSEEGTYRNYAYTRNGNPASVRALPESGEAEIRYVTGQEGVTLASRPITVLEADVLVAGPEAVDAGAEIEVTWKGPGNQGDYITIVKQDAKPGTYHSYAYTKNNKDGKVTITAVEEPGDDYELRYVEGQKGQTLASAPIVVRPISASVEGPESIIGGAEAEIRWIGPKYQGAYITIVAKDTKIGTYGKYFYTKNETSPTMLKAIEEAGPAEIRFMSPKGNVLASASLEIIAATAEFLDAPSRLTAGDEVRIHWKGPDNDRDFITLVKAGERDSAYGTYIYAGNGKEQDLKVPDEPGEYELRYVTEQKKTVLAREKVTVVAE